jgi:hypothetical protein
VRAALADGGIDLPVPDCPEVTRWLAEMRPTGVALVFSEAYLNNPPSMFGHTLLRIISARYHSPLLSPSVEFAAQTEEEQGVGFAFKGMFGGYTGRFTLGWYGDMVRRYGAVENRDIWEYRLNFSPSETEFMLLHVRELQAAGFDYYFLDENCSGQLLGLLAAVRPAADLSEPFTVWVMPLDTVRVVEAAGMVEDVVYRPSRLSILHRREGHLSTVQLNTVAALCRAPIEKWDDLNIDPAVLEPAVLDSAIECRFYEQIRKNGIEDTNTPELAALLAASRAAPSSRDLAMPMADPSLPPSRGHKSSSLDVQVGIEDGDEFIGLGYRPALRDLLDPPDGYPTGAQVELLRADIRLYPEDSRLELEQFKLVDILSVPPAGRLIRPLAWTVDGGVSRMAFAEKGRPLTGHLRLGAGISRQPADGLLVYGLLGAQLLAGDQFTHYVDGAPGAMAGLVHQVNQSVSLAITGEFWHYVVDDATASYAAGARVRYYRRPGWSYFADFGVIKEFADDQFRLILGVRKFF